MKRALVIVVALMLSLFGLMPVAVAQQQNQPSQGQNSTGRNPAGFGGGPHCHVLIVDSAQAQFDFIRVFPSHRAHAASGLQGGVFAADADCDGVIPAP